MLDDRSTDLSGHPYRRPQTPTRSTAPFVPRESRGLQLLMMLLIALGGWIGYIGWRERRLDAAVAAMPAVVQEASYRRALEELATTCATQPQLEDHCRAEATFIMRFPQCNQDCKELARRYLAHARR